jgi:RNA polymerase sigma-70 factor (ECF subfamily)
MDEPALVGHAQAGDAAAFSALFEAYHSQIIGYLYRLVGDREVAEDLAQDTFMKAYRALGRTNDGLNFRAWLYRIATNTATSYYRRRKIIQWLPFGPATPEPSGELRLAEALGERELIEAVLEKLNSSYVTVLLLRHQQGLSLEETAAVLGTSVNAAKVRLFRARRAFVEAYRALDAGQEAGA